MKKLLCSLALLSMLTGCKVEINTNADLSEVFYAPFEFDSVEEMNRYLDEHDDIDSELFDTEDLLAYLKENVGNPITVESHVSKINDDNFTISQDSITCSPVDPTMLEHIEVGEDLTLYGKITSATTIEVSGWED